MTEFCNNNKQLPLRISVKNYENNGPHKLYGSVNITCRGIEMLREGEDELEIRNAKGRVTGRLTFNNFQMDMRPSLLEYLKHGW